MQEEKGCVENQGEKCQNSRSDNMVVEMEMKEALIQTVEVMAEVLEEVM